MSATDFDVTCTSDSFLDCTSDSSNGRRIAGDLDGAVVTLYGTRKFGPSTYRLSLPRRSTDELWGPDCSWYADDVEAVEANTPLRVGCSADCWAEILIGGR